MTIRKFAVVGFAIGTMACRNESTQPLQQTRPPSMASVAQVRGTATGPTFDDLGDAVAEEEPGFGGFYVDEQHRLVVWAGDTTRGEQVRAAIGRHFVVPELATLPLLVRKAKYDVRDLRVWRKSLETGLLGQRWSAADLDETIDRITITVDNLEVAVAVVAMSQRLGVPTDAVVTTIQDPGKAMQTPDNRTVQTGIRPIPGGVNISNFPYGFDCTLAFIAKTDTSSSQMYAVTASHCTPHVATNDSTLWYQYSDSLFGREWYEAPFTTTLGHGPGPNPCTSGYTCRYADAMLMKLYGNYSTAYGKIARTVDSVEYYSGGAASILVDSTVTPVPTYSILAETTMGSLYNGFVVHKMGSRSGHTWGPINHTCVDQNPAQGAGFISTSLYVCQFSADMYIQPGDSGSPVFFQSGGYTILTGIVWLSAGNSSFFSPIDGIHFDLGPIATYPNSAAY